MITPKILKISDDPNYLQTKRILLPFGAGEWDYLGSSTFRSSSKTFYSGGGNLKIYISIPRRGGAKWLFRLYEEDPAWHWTVSSFEVSNNPGTYSITFDVRGLPDGDNGKAELHLSKLTYPSDYVTTDWYD